MGEATKRWVRFATVALGLVVAGTAVWAAFPADSDTPTEGWKYGFRSIIDTAQYPIAQDKEDASGMSLEAAWKDTVHWPPLASSGGTFSSLGRPDVVVGYIEGGVNYWRNGADQLIKKIYVNRNEVMANPTCAARYVDNGDPWFNVLDFAGTPDHNGNGYLDPEDLIVECQNGVDDDANGYVDDVSGWDFYNRQNNPHSQDVTYGHHNGQMLNGEAGINDGGTLGACPLCMVMPIRAGAEALDRSDDLAQAFLFAADSGAASVASLTADLGYSTFMRQAQEHLWRSNVLVAEASNDFDSTDHQGGMYWPHAIAGNGVLKENEGGLPVPNCFPGSQFCVPGDLTTRTFRQRSGQTSWGTRNMVSVSGTASTSASTGTLGGVLGLLQSWNRTAVELGYIPSLLTGPEVVQLLIATASDIDPSDFTLVPNAWPTQLGWDLQTGYGRINARRFQEELRLGNIRPVAWFDAPEWFTLYDPTVQPTVEIFGHTEARRAPDGAYTWTLQWAVGAEPTDAQFQTLASGARTAPFDGKLGELAVGSIPAAVYAQAFSLSTQKQLETMERYTVTLRLRVTYQKSPGVSLTGEERRSIAVHRDDDWMAGFPRRIRSGGGCAGGQIAAGAPADYCFSPGGESQPALADLGGLGRLQIVFGDTDGYVHAVDPATGGELPGFPVTTDANAIVRSGCAWAGVNPGFEPMPSNVAVGDLDHDGNLWIVAGTSTGRLYVWDATGQRRAGWPVTPAEGVVPLESPRIPREFSRVPHQGLFAAPILSDWDGDGDLEIIQAGYDGHIHLYEADGSEVTTGGWPIQVRVPDSVPITRPALNNPTDTRTPIRMQDFRISSNPALAQLDADPELEIVVRSQMSDTFPSDDIEVLSGVGHLNAYDHDGTYLWTAKMDSATFYYGSAQEFITEGSNSPAVADIDGDGRDEVVSNPVFSLNAYPFKGDGTPFGAAPWTSPPAGLPDPVLPIPDVPVGFTTSGAFGMFGGALTFAQPGSGAASIIAALLTAGSGQPIVNKERAWNASTGAVVPGFPSKLQGLNFLGAPIFVDVTGDGLAEIVDGGDSSALHGYMVGGLQAVTAGFPKFTTGWMLWSPTAGDLDSDGTIEVVANTREGYTMVWRTPGLASANVEWWRYGHDEWNTRRYGTDSRPPGILRAAAVDADARTLTFTAPGDDWYVGRPALYRITHAGGVVDVVAAVDSGAQEIVTLPAGVDQGTVQAVDDAGNLGRALGFDLTGGTTDGVRLIHGKRLVVRDTTNAGARTVTWITRDARVVVPPAGERPTEVGASLVLFNPTTSESTSLPMPASGWTQSQTGAFRYADPRQANGPVRRAVMKPGRITKVTARGIGIAFRLNEPSQGSLAVGLIVGGGPYCTLFGGQVRVDVPGRFVAANAGRPPTCALP